MTPAFERADCLPQTARPLWLAERGTLAYLHSLTSAPADYSFGNYRHRTTLFGPATCPAIRIGISQVLAQPKLFCDPQSMELPGTRAYEIGMRTTMGIPRMCIHRLDITFLGDVYSRSTAHYEQLLKSDQTHTWRHVSTFAISSGAHKRS
jgi:hypothetical protein